MELVVLLLAVFLSQAGSLPTNGGTEPVTTEAGPIFEPIPSSQTPCTVKVTRTFNRTMSSLNFETGEVTVKIVQENVIAEKCCEGWEGDDCNIPVKKPEVSPCWNVTCQAFPTAECAIIKRCGMNIPLFIDKTGRVVEECLSEDLCLGVCMHDPCKGLTCERYPKALCFTSSCGCEAVWLLPSKKRVSDCSLTGDKVKRQSDTQCQ